MTKTRRNLLVVMIIFLLLLATTILYGCSGDSKGGENCVVSGNGTILEKTDDEGVLTYTAVAEKWNVFSGWYDGMDKYSDKATIVVDSKTPDGLIAKFETSGTLSIDRALNGAYNRYSEAIQTQANYLNLQYDTTLSIKGDVVDSTLDIERGGYFALNGEGFHDYLLMKENEKNVFASYYIDDSKDAMLYLNFNGRKVKVDDFMSIGKKILNLPNASNEIWKLENLIEDDIFSMIDGYLGFRNAVGFIGKVENSKNQTKITFNLDRLLNELKNKLSAVTDPAYEGIKAIVNTLTSQYSGIGNLVPKIIFDIEIDYILQGEVERISAITINGTFEEDYKFMIEGNLIEIPACKMSVKIENAQISLSETPNVIPAEIIASFPEDVVHAVNVHADGILSFLKQNVATLDLNIIDQYKIELDADINHHFLKNAINEKGEFDTRKVDWEEFGFLSFRILLIENEADNQQSLRHGGSTEYLNILIDTKNFGAKAFIYVDLYNPQTLRGMATSKYVLSGSYDLAKLFEVMPQVVKNLTGEEGEVPESQTISKLSGEMLIASILANCIGGAVDLETGEVTADEVLFDLFVSMLDKIVPNNSLIKEGMTYSEFGGTLAVEEIKKLISEEFESANSTLSSLGLHNNIFGESTSHIAIKANKLLYGSVIKNQLGEYVDEAGISFAKKYNAAHKMLVGVAEGTEVIGLTDKEFSANSIESELEELVGSSVVVSEGLFSDGSTSSKFTNCQGNQAEISMKIYRAEFKIINENTAEITAYLTFSAGTLQSLLVGTFDIPYGLIEFKTTITLS